jgi:hypothetical protein
MATFFLFNQEYASNDKLLLNASGSFVVVSLDAFRGWSFDAIIDATVTANGIIDVYFDNSASQVFANITPIISLQVTNGLYAADGSKSFTFDSNNATASTYITIRWTGTDPNNGVINFNGYGFSI